MRKITPVLRLGVYREKVEACNTRSSGNYIEEIHTVQLDQSSGMSSLCICDSLLDEPMLFVAEVMDERLLAHLQPYDRILSINGKDVDDMGAKVATQLIKGMEKVTLVVSRKRLDTDESTRQKISESEEKLHKQTNLIQKWNMKSQNNGSNEEKINDILEKGRSRSTVDEMDTNPEMQQINAHTNGDKNFSANSNKTVRIEDTNLNRRTVVITKGVNESLGMRIGGGVGSSEGDIPIYIANIHPQGCVGRTQEILKGDILLNVGEISLIGLTHSQAVAVLKATVGLSQVTLTVFEGPETSLGSYNFIPSWLYWQHLPRSLQYPKTVIIHRTAKESLGFSIVGGEDPVRGPEPIHVLYVVQDSPAAIEGKLRSGDRLLAVDGHSLEGIKHSTAVSMLKRTGSKVTLQVVSWMGTEL
ncbi:hypothetical protein J437_LFUL003707 [Ladona fulva]|uniref:PDZ domain-containing protein n=1 Tax=Ladona fulva TaxID=123851 RepID=A0A8K0NT87_LADFU|nr:hypothetical protein J437_LFUL003707 [Ladona fulva]